MGQTDGQGRIEVACFTKGTRIATPTGDKRIETLRAGERVLTRDSGVQEIAWIGRRQLGWESLRANPHLKPVVIKRDAFGPGHPERDVQLSPNHRVLVAGDRETGASAETELLAPVRYLLDDKRVLGVEAMGVTYYHLMFERHQVVLSDGIWSESFQPCDFGLRAVGNAQRLEILELFPDLRTPEGIGRYVAARSLAGPNPPRRVRRD